MLAIAAVNFSLAQAPEAFKYQTVVRDGSQNIITNQPIGVQVRILQGGSSGTSVYSETHTGVTNAYGLMNLEIGNGTVGSGNFSTIDWSNSGPYFLEISVDITGGTSYTLMGASELLSVPYALRAASADNVNDADADPTNEYNTGAALNGTDLEITDGGGTITVDMSSLGGGVDPSSTNELNTSFQLIGTTLNITDPGGTLSADLSSLGGGGNPTDELNSTFQLVGTTLSITDAGGTLSADLSSLGGGGNWTTSGNNIYNSNTGNVGVGGTNPTSKLHVNATPTTANPYAVRVDANNTSGTAITSGVYVVLDANNPGEATSVYGETNINNTGSWAQGVVGRADGSTVDNRGVQGVVNSSGTNNIGVVGFSEGVNSSTNTGVYGRAGSSTVENNGVVGYTDGTATNSRAVYGVSESNGTNNAGVEGYSNGNGTYNRGLYGVSEGGGSENIGVTGISFGNGVGSFNIGAEGQGVGTGGDYNIGIWGQANTGGTSGNYAAYLVGDVVVTGNLSKGGGTFKIDHPQDPANKYLIHSFVESPDMINIYNGNVVTDANGFVTVTMPDYFDSANKDFKYQLTVIGTFAQAIIKEKINGNQFVIQTSEPNVEVSWQVTGVRADKWADENRVIPVMDKEQPGTYMHPELFDQPKEKSVLYRESPVQEEDNSNKESVKIEQSK